MANIKESLLSTAVVKYTNKSGIGGDLTSHSCFKYVDVFFIEVGKASMI